MRTPTDLCVRAFVPWVESNEPGVLTYALFARRKAPNELLLFVRYVDGKTLKAHNVAPEHIAVVYVLQPPLNEYSSRWS
jgi:quinol monooxygenase YgiN